MTPALAVALGAPVAKKYSSPRTDGQTIKRERESEADRDECRVKDKGEDLFSKQSEEVWQE